MATPSSPAPSSPSPSPDMRITTTADRVEFELSHGPDGARYRLAMRKGPETDRQVALTGLALALRGYTMPWDSLAPAVATQLAAMGDPTPTVATEDRAIAIATQLVHDGVVTSLPNRDDDAALWETLLADDDAVDAIVPVSRKLPTERLQRMRRWWGMLNRAMRDRLERGECVDLSDCERLPDGSYVIPRDVFQEDIDFCDAEREQWITSVGRELSTNRILAALDGRYYQNDDFRCLFLR